MMSNTYRNTRRDAVEAAAKKPSEPTEPTELQITAAQSRIGEYWFEEVSPCGEESGHGLRLDNEDERKLIKDMLRAALNV